MSLFVFGIGYSAGYFVRNARNETAVGGTVRTIEGVDALRREGVASLRFDGAAADPAVEEALAAAEHLLVSVQPGPAGCPVLTWFGEAVSRSPRIRRIVYLSTIGVYGDHGGAWIDEETPAEPASERGRVRLGVEAGWLALGRPDGPSVHVLRLAGIYGPGRNALHDLAHGEARRINKPGQVFNRIHVADIAGAVEAAFASEGQGRVWNVTDDEPAPAPDVVAYAAKLMGVSPPAEIDFADAALSPMARSFYAANRRVSNQAIKHDLGLRLAYPTYRHGLDALWAAREGY